MRGCLLVSFTVLVLLCQFLSEGKKFEDKDKPAWAKKDIRDYSEADLERLLDQWEEDEDPLEPDELPEHLRPQPSLDFNNLPTDDPEALMKLTKKGKTLMTFVEVSGKPTRDETEQITKIWQTSLWNNHIPAEKYIIEDNRALFVFKDGAQAYDAKEYLIQQELCKSVTIDNKVYPGKFAPQASATVEKVSRDEF